MLFKKRRFFSIFLILAFGTFYFVKSLNLSGEAALIASLSFTFASGIVARIIHIQILGTIAYLPILLWLTQKFFSHIFYFFTICILGVSLSAVHLVPGWELFQDSGRSGDVGSLQIKEHPFHPGELRYFLQPTPIGPPSLGNYDSPYQDPGIFWENTSYVSLLGLFLGV